MDTSPDRIVVAQLRGVASRHARWTPPLGDARAQAVDELRAIATQGHGCRAKLRADLLAEAAGVLEGFNPPGGSHRPQAEIARDLLIEAGADRGLLDHWRKVGMSRRAVPLPGAFPR